MPYIMHVKELQGASYLIRIGHFQCGTIWCLYCQQGVILQTGNAPDVQMTQICQSMQSTININASHLLHSSSSAICLSMPCNCAVCSSNMTSSFLNLWI